MCFCICLPTRNTCPAGVCQSQPIRFAWSKRRPKRIKLPFVISASASRLLWTSLTLFAPLSRPSATWRKTKPSILSSWTDGQAFYESKAISAIVRRFYRACVDRRRPALSRIWCSSSLIASNPTRYALFRAVPPFSLKFDLRRRAFSNSPSLCLSLSFTSTEFTNAGKARPETPRSVSSDAVSMHTRENRECALSTRKTCCEKIGKKRKKKYERERERECEKNVRESVRAQQMSTAR